MFKQIIQFVTKILPMLLVLNGSLVAMEEKGNDEQGQGGPTQLQQMLAEARQQLQAQQQVEQQAQQNAPGGNVPNNNNAPNFKTRHEINWEDLPKKIPVKFELPEELPAIPDINLNFLPKPSHYLSALGCIGGALSLYLMYKGFTKRAEGLAAAAAQTMKPVASSQNSSAIAMIPAAVSTRNTIVPAIIEVPANTVSCPQPTQSPAPASSSSSDALVAQGTSLIKYGVCSLIASVATIFHSSISSLFW